MANIALFVPNESMYEDALRAVNAEEVSLHLLKVVQTKKVLEEARLVVEDGADIIVARGMQAQLIKLHTNVPLVEIRYTGQELGKMVLQAKNHSGKEKPTIAIVGFENSFSDMRYFEELYGVTLLVYYVTHPDDILPMVEKAISKHADVILGGERVLEAASQLNVVGMFLESTEESVCEALRIAKTAAYARDMEKQGVAQIESVMDTTDNGIIKIDSQGNIAAVNTRMETILGKTESALLGKAIAQEIRGLSTEQIATILSGEHHRLSFTLRARNTLLMVMAAPIQYNNFIDGAIFTFHKVKPATGKGQTEETGANIHAYMAKRDFNHILRNDKHMKKHITCAQVYALSKNPVLIYGEEGTEKDIFAEAIHQNSPRRAQAFVRFSCASFDEKGQMEQLFGHGEDKGLLHRANYGSLFLQDIASLHPVCQTRLYKSLFSLTENGLTHEIDLRLIATESKKLEAQVEDGSFSKDLYFALNALSISLEPLRENPEQTVFLAEKYIEQYAEQYMRRLSLSEGGGKVIEQYPWPGNLMQLQRFCERLVLDCNKRRIEEGFVKALLQELYPNIQITQTGEKVLLVTQDPQAEKIRALLTKYNGRRNLVAKELGISTTTLWRYMKRYGLDLPL